MQTTSINVILLVAALEKFIINGLRAGMVIFLIRQSGLSSGDALIKSTTFLALNYSLPLLCGLLLDKFPKVQSSILSMGYFIALFCLIPIAFPIGTFDLVAAALLTFSGFVKVLTPILLKEQIRFQDKARAAQVFTNLYTAFNVGTILGTFVIAVIGEALGWNYSFVLIAAAVLVITMLLGKKGAFLLSAFAFIGFTILTWGLLAYPALSWYFIYLLIIVSVALLYRNFHGHLGSLGIFLYVALTHTIFFAIYEQAATSFIVLSERAFTHFNSALPVTLLNALDPALNIALGIAFVFLWKTRLFSHFSDRTLLRFSLGFVALLPALWLLKSASAFSDLQSGITLFCLSTLFFVVAEQFIVPAGFAFAATSARPGMAGAVMGAWYTAISSSEKLAGVIALFLVGNSDSLEALSRTYSAGIDRLVYLCGFILLVSTGLTVFIGRTKRGPKL